MTQEEKAKAYDEALEKARARYDKEPTDGYVGYANQILKELFPTLADSKDERIRKEIITYLSNELHNVKQLTPRTDEFEKWITWLSLKFRIGDIIKYKSKQWTIIGIDFDNHCYDLTNDECVDFDTAHYEFELEKQKEEEGYEEIPVESTLEYKLGFKAGKESEKQKEQKPADDKAFEEWIDDWWKHNKVNNPDSYDKGDEIQFDERGFKNFCRGIRNMYQQKPAEWSEEDGQWLESIIKDYEDSLTKDKGHAAVIKIKIDFLKSLRPQPHWKPSEEQMKALEDAFRKDGSDEYRKTINSLYQDLKKL